MFIKHSPYSKITLKFVEHFLNFSFIDLFSRQKEMQLHKNIYEIKKKNKIFFF